MGIINALLCFLLLLVSLPILFLTIETLSAISLKGRSIPDCLKRPKITVIIPAYNEEALIASCIASIQPQLTSADKILVIADNCNDSTAAIAQKMNVQVIERKDESRTGKGYAISSGFSALTDNPPDVVVIIDADVISKPKTIEQIASLAFQTGRPVQARYMLKPPENAEGKSLISAFAFCFKNLIRPLGLYHLGFPCLLTGSGMAMPWPIISSISFMNSSIVEDMQLAVDLAVAGFTPLFCPEAHITGILPDTNNAAMRQRIRWEHGHLSTIFKYAPKIFFQSVKQKRLDLFAIGMELIIPPLSFLTFLWSVITTSIFIFTLFNITSCFLLACALGSGFLLAFSIFLGWFFFARSFLPLRILFVAPLYILAKLPIYAKFFVNPEKRWIRTERKNETSDSRERKRKDG